MHFESALYVGRFQPPHLGHLRSLEHALSFADTALVGLRNTELGLDNPLSVDERALLWKKLLEKAAMSDKIVLRGVPDFRKGQLPREDKVVVREKHPLLNWAEQVERLFGITPERTVFVGNKPPMVLAFNLLGYVVIPGHRSVHRLVEVSATDLRRRILGGDESWKAMLPEPVVQGLVEIGITKRLHELSQHGPARLTPRNATGTESRQSK